MVLLAVLPAALLAACGAPRAPSAASSGLETPVVDVVVAPAFRGDIAVTTLYAAKVEAAAQVDVVSLATGRLKTLSVGLGSEVKEGQVIAELSHRTLEAQLKQAQADLAAVKAAARPNELKARAQLDAVRAGLNQLLNPASSDLRVAQSSVATAQSNLDRAKTKLNQLRNPSASDLQSAESAVATAQSKLEGTQTRLDQILNPSMSDLQAARSAVSAAQGNLNSAKIDLDQLQTPLASDLQDARSAVAKARSDLDSAKIKLSDLQNPPAADLAAAQTGVAEAQAELGAAQSKVNAAIAKESSVSWQLLLGARIRLQANQATLDNPVLSWGLTPEEIADAEEAVAANQAQISLILKQIISAPLVVSEDLYNNGSLIPQEIRTALWGESQALKALETSKARLQELESPRDDTVSLAESNVAAAQAALDSAGAKYRELQKPSETTIALARNRVDIAQASFDAANEWLKEMENPSKNTISLVRNDVAIAQTALVKAQAGLTELQTPSRDAVALGQHEADAAQALLDAAQARLSLLKTPRPAESAAANMAVAVAEQSLNLDQEPYVQYGIQAAQAKVEQIEAQLMETQVLAPFDGFVTQAWIAPGAMASPQIPIVTVVSKDVVVSLRAEETLVNSLQKGQIVQFTSPGLPNQQLDLRIDGIAPAGEQKAHTFTVLMSPVVDMPGLKPGISGQISILNRHENVVLVPKGAVRRQGGQSSLFMVQNGAARLVNVSEGLADERNVEIMSGVQSGGQGVDQVVIVGQNLLNDATLVKVVSK